MPDDADPALSLALSDASPVEVSAFLRSRVREIAARGGRTASTRRAYTDAAHRLLPWIERYQVDASAMGAEHAAAALLALGLGQPPYSAPCSSSSVRLTATAVRVALTVQGFDAAAWCSAEVVGVLRELDARAAPKACTPIRLADLRRMLDVVAPTGLGIRIRAALCVGYAGALRVSELSSLQWSRVGRDGQDSVVQVRRKRHTEWCNVALLATSDANLCPVRHLDRVEGLDRLACNIDGNARIFGAPRTIQGWVQAMATRAGLVGAFSPHSLRHGWASDAASAGIPLSAIQRHLGHASPSSTARYARHADLRAFY